GRRGPGLRLDLPRVLLRSRGRGQPAPHYPPGGTTLIGLHAAPERGWSVGVRPPACLPDAGRARHRGRLPTPPGRPLILLLAAPRPGAAHLIRPRNRLGSGER